MKTLRYITVMAATVLLFASCEKEDGLSDQNAGKERPAAEVALDKVKSAYFTFTITPSEGTAFYSYVVLEGNDNASPLAFDMLAGEYSGAYDDGVASHYEVVKVDADAEDNSTTVVVYTEAVSDYQVYVVAMDADGLCSEVDVTDVTTTERTVVKEGHFALNYPSLAEYDVVNENTGVPFGMTIYQEKEDAMLKGYYILLANWFNYYDSYCPPFLIGYQDEVNECLVFDGTCFYPDEEGNYVVQNYSAFSNPVFFHDEEQTQLVCFWGSGETGVEPLCIFYDENGNLTTTTYFDYTIHDAETGTGLALYDACVEGTLEFMQALE